MFVNDVAKGIQKYSLLHIDNLQCERKML